jgi:hypothetical protein
MDILMSYFDGHLSSFQFFTASENIIISMSENAEDLGTEQNTKHSI